MKSGQTSIVVVGSVLCAPLPPALSLTGAAN